MRPLGADLAGFLLPISLGVSLFLLGRGFRHWSRPRRALTVALPVAAALVGCLTLAGALPLEAEKAAYRVADPTTCLCWVALYLLGVVVTVPGRSTSTPFTGFLAAVAVLVIGVEASGRLWWRFVAPETWVRTADSHGILRQSSNLSCSPCAAVMLLHRVGISASEGEMAYLAGTSPLGTDAHGITRALEAKAGPHGYRVVTERTTYEECLRRQEPFLAHIEGQSYGHAILVAGITPEGVDILDPADGSAYTLPRDQFEREWTGIAVRLIR